MSNFPTTFDDDTTLPPINNNISEIGGELFNALREAVFNIENNIGLTAAGSCVSLSERLGISILPDGSIKPSAIASMGLVTLPIYNSHIAATAAIDESKLNLDHSTQDLYNYTRNLSTDINSNSGWVSATGVKVNPHIAGTLYRHSLSHITVGTTEEYLVNKFAALRANTNSYTLINDINNELLHHQFADSTSYSPTANITTHGGYTYSSDYAHTARGIFVDSSNFISVSTSVNNLQLLADFIDQSSIFLYGSRIQNFYANGISRKSHSSSLRADGYGQNIIPPTNVTAYLRSNGVSSSPVDDIDEGDDIIEFLPSSGVTNHTFDAKFSKVKPGDVIKINYGSVETSFIVKEKKYIQDGVNKKYAVRIAGKNLVYTTSGIARIDRSLSNTSKFATLAVSTANNNFSEKSSLIVGSPRGASVLGIGFNPDLFDNAHYLLYLAIYTTGSPEDGYTILPPVDVTGNRGTTPGSYTLESIVQSTNDQFRKAGYNYRFNAFTYGGEFGIMLSDSYNNCSFSILNVVVASNGSLDVVGTAAAFIKNVVGVFTTGDQVYAPDPLGFGTYGANIASPAYMSSYGSTEASQFPTKIFSPLKRNNFYVNGIEKEKLTTELFQEIDGYGDGYWTAQVVAQTIFPGPSPSGRVRTSYRVNKDLSSVDIQAGKTIVVQKNIDGYFIDFGRFTIEEVVLGNTYSDIIVYDSVHGSGISPSSVSGVGSYVSLYFGSDSVSFNSESSTDFTALTGFKSYFEVYIDEASKTFTHQRARVNIGDFNLSVNEGVTLYTNSELAKLNIIEVSPKLKGYQVGSVNKISLHTVTFNNNTTNNGEYTGYLCYYNGTDVLNKGPLVTGKVGAVTRFYDETNIDYIDILFDPNVPVSDVSDVNIDIQLFPTLSLDEDIMLLASCQLNDSLTTSYLRDRRQFGNISEKELTTSALNFISASDRLLHANGVVRGFELSTLLSGDNPSENQIYINGGVALVNGKLLYINNQTVAIPTIKESRTSLYDINWALCINDKGEYQAIPLLDYDAALATPTVINRNVKAFNPATGVSYYIDASTFSNIINNRKDLTILYVVASTVDALVSPATINLSITDARRYVNDSDSNLPLRLTSNNAQGNFKSPVAILNWVKFNNQFNGMAFVKGATSETGIINNALTLDFDSIVTIDGENDAILTINQPMILGSNITFKNLTIIFNAGVKISSSPSNIIFDNCNITYTESVDFAAPISNVIFNISAGNNITFKDCSINVTYVRTASGGSIFKLTDTNNASFINTDVTVAYNVIANSTTPGNVFNLITSSGVLITKSTFTGNFSEFMIIDKSDSLVIDDVSITSSYNPNISSPADFGYDTTNLVNHGHGFIYSDVSTTLNKIYINNVSFNYSPAVASGDRFSFINFTLSNVNSILSNLTITNCKFYHLKTSVTVEDIRPAIAIINTAAISTVTSQQPLLLNATIKNNYCNRNQSIILTSIASSNIMNYPGLVPQGCIIENNICGMIGYWLSSGSKVLSISPNINSLSDKDSGMLINNNTCHYIATVDYNGKYWNPFNGSVLRAKYPSSNVIITNNRSSWIHSGVCYEENSSLKVTGNTLVAYDTSFLTTYSTPSDISAYAMYIASNLVSNPSVNLPGEGNNSNCIINGNTTSKGYWLSSIASPTTYSYTHGYIWTLSSVIIKDNVLKGIASGDASAPLIIEGLHNTVTNNKIYRGDSDTAAYILVYSASNTLWDGTGSTGIITDNFFDSPYINSSLSEVTVNFVNTNALSGWIVKNNINQTVTVALPLTNSQIFSQGSKGFNTLDGEAGTYYITNAPSHQYGYKSPVLRIHDGYTATTREIGWQENVDKYLPIGSRVVAVSMAIRGFGSTVTTSTPTSGIRLFLNKYASNSDYNDLNHFNSPPPSLVPAGSVISAGNADDNITNDTVDPQTYTVTAADINALGASSSILMSINTTTGGSGGSDISSDFIAGKNYSFGVSVDIVFKRTSTTVDFYLAPVIIKYRW